MKKIFIFFILLTQIHAFGQSSVLIEPNGSNGIFSKNATPVITEPTPVTLPASGAGTRLMWIPSKSAFRVGTIDGTQWDAGNIGTWSFATGYNTKAYGAYSTSMGYQTMASGYSSTSIGYQTTASGPYSTSMGNNTTANGFHSTSMGYGTTASGTSSTSMGDGTTASGTSSTSMGNGATANGSYSSSIGLNTTANGYASLSLGNATTASGDYSTAVGHNTTAQPINSLALGKYNIISGTPDTWISTEPLVIVGNGTGVSSRNNALTLLKNSNLGLNTATPQYPLTFKDDLGDKISLYYGNTSNTTNHYGMGIQSAKFQLFTPSDQDDLVFGYGRSAAFTENVRFKGTGLVGIGVNNPSEFLDVNGRIRARHRPINTAGVWMSNSLNSTAVGDGAFYGLRTDTEAGIFIGGAWRFGVTNAGVVSASGGISVGGGETISKIKKTTYTYDIPPVSANSQYFSTFPIPSSDLLLTDNFIVNPQSPIFPLIITTVRTVDVNFIEVDFYNPTNAEVNVSSTVFNITIIK